MVTEPPEPTPKNATHWSTRAMAEERGRPRSTVSRIWRAFGRQPHRTETFKPSTDPYFGDKAHDVVGLYPDPPERAPVFRVDEKSRIQSLGRSRPVSPRVPGSSQRITHDCARAGIATLFAALEAATGKVIGSLHRRYRAEEFGKFPTELDQEAPVGPDVRKRSPPRGPADRPRCRP
ncbi:MULTISPECIES: IS630 family transposase [Streptomyces]|uniref:IS630 family transposase n=1 Tax=Streptomyces TaxID=1883 RepID=UPI000689BDB2|nr:MULTISPECIES: IS630 family transposase [Streptomyces]